MQETLIAAVKAETLNIDASALNSGKAFSRVASKLVYSWAFAELLVCPNMQCSLTVSILIVS